MRVDLNEYVCSNLLLYASMALAEIKRFIVPKSTTSPFFLIKMSVNIGIESAPIISPSIYQNKNLMEI